MSLDAVELSPPIPLTRYRLVKRLSSQGSSLTVTVRLMPEDVEWEVHFGSLVGYRVFDERDLPSYWPACSRGTVFEIAKGGWLSKPDFDADLVLAGFYGEVREFFVAGEGQCVSVLATEPPTISQGH
jgi:hypothetical protein